MWTKTITLFAIAILVLCPVAANAQRTDIDDFRDEFKPQVGKRITVRGVLQTAKLGWLVSFKDWGVYIYPEKSSNLRLMSRLAGYNQHGVEATGTLRYFAAPKPSQANVAVAAAPEHFYFDIAEVKVISGEPADLKESAKKPFAVTVAPGAALTAFRQFFAYVSKSEPGIIKDEQAQAKWLSKSLRDGLKQKVNSFKDQPDSPDFPSNATFVGAWDAPTTFTVLGSRRYNNRVVIDVWYAWGKNTNYEGDSRLSYFIFQLEDGVWKLDDVYTFNGAFAQAESLNSYLWGKRN